MSERGSKELAKYYKELSDKIIHQKKIAIEARKRIASPTPYIEVFFARDLAERVELLVGPRGVADKIRSSLGKMSLEKLALKLAKDIIEEHGKEKIDNRILLQAIRTSLAILTPPCITAAPTEGVVDVKIKKNFDGSRYLAIYFAGPIRSAGGTELAAVVVLADYVRRLVGLDRYKPTYEEVMRFIEELRLYKRKVSRFQYNVPDDVIEYVLKNLPVEVTGIPTDKILVSSFRNLPRIETNYLRGGALRVINDGIAGRAKKVLKFVEKIGLDGWEWIGRVIEIMDSVKNEDEGYLDEVVGGRPVISVQDRFGGLRIRYGRTASTGLASVGLHPVTLEILNWYIVSGTQLKLDYPGKGGIVSVVEYIEPPVVLTVDGEVARLENHTKYEKIKDKIEKILFLGDILVSVGDLIENNVKIHRPGFCEEWWCEELRLRISRNASSNIGKELYEKIERVLSDPFNSTPTVREALLISLKLGVPLHPKYTPFWRNIVIEEAFILREWLKNSVKNLIHKNGEVYLPKSEKAKDILTRLLIEHRVELDKVVLSIDWLKTLMAILRPFDHVEPARGDILDILSKLSGIIIEDKAGTFIGARMGRPEKAAMREMSPPVNILFPAGSSGGPSRDLINVLNEDEKIVVELVRRRCPNCGKKTWIHKCPECRIPTDIIGECDSCGSEKKYDEETICEKCGGNVSYYEKFVINVAEKLYEVSREINMPLPGRIKGVKGLNSLTKTPEDLAKGILRARYELYVYKDGTIRFDATNAPLTHFKPSQIGTPIDKLRELGYTHDIFGEPLTSPNQILELRIQDIIIPRRAAEHLLRVSKFIDDELKKLAGMDTYYNFEKPEDIIGELVLVLSPHTYVGSVTRVIGIIDGLVCFAHPVLHAAKRRDCDGDEDSIMLLLDPLINFSRLYLPNRVGGKMDSPLLITSIVYPEEVDEQAHNLDVIDRYPLEFYRKAKNGEHISTIASIIPTIKNYLGRPEAFAGCKFTHPLNSLISTVKESSYKKHSSMLSKIAGQIDIVEKLTGVDVTHMVEKIMETHLLPDIVGNARAFFTQEFRCKKCGSKYRRPPLTRRCHNCGADLKQTVFRGAIEKYVELAEELLGKYVRNQYLREQALLAIDGVKKMFTKEEDGEVAGRQVSLEKFM
ncbi:MAG: DNA polymerase II large subunit [Nitrososphaerota archaeon]